MVFAATTQGCMLTRNRWWETALLLIAFVKFRPGSFWHRICPELETWSATELDQFVSDLPSGKQLRLPLQGEKLNGDQFTMGVSLAAGNKAPAEERLQAMGFAIRNEDGRFLVDNVVFNSPAEKAGIDWDPKITTIRPPTDRPNSGCSSLAWPCSFGSGGHRNGGSGGPLRPRSALLWRLSAETVQSIRPGHAMTKNSVAKRVLHRCPEISIHLRKRVPKHMHEEMPDSIDMP